MNRSMAAGLLALPLLAGGCASAGMEVPADLTTVEPMPVEGRGGWRGSQRAAFGDWEATDVDRSWNRGSGWRIGIGPLGGGSDKARQEYSFRFSENGVQVDSIGCLAVGSRSTGTTDVVDIDLAAREALECRPLGVAEGEEPAWDLVLEAKRDRHLTGFLRVGDARYDVVSTGKGGGMMPAMSFGFEIRQGEHAVAAVETVNEGAVWIAPAVAEDHRTALAAAAAALLLYDRVEGGD